MTALLAVLAACVVMAYLVWAADRFARHPHDHDTPSRRCSICGASSIEEMP